MWNTQFFGENEFSKGELLAKDINDYAQRLAWLLDPVRQFSRGPLKVTSFWRSGKGSHGTGCAVDVQPSRGVDKYIRRIADFMAALYLPGEKNSPLHQIIYEAPEPGQHRAHIHIVLTEYEGRATPGYLLDLDGNRKYVKTAIPRITLETS